MWLTRICLQTLAGNSCQKYSIILKCVKLKLILKLCHVLHTLTRSEDLADKALKLWKFFIHQHLNIYSISHVKSFKYPNIWLYKNINSFQSKIYKRMFVLNLFWINNRHRSFLDTCRLIWILYGFSDLFMRRQHIAVTLRHARRWI